MDKILVAYRVGQAEPSSPFPIREAPCSKCGETCFADAKNIDLVEAGELALVCIECVMPMIEADSDVSFGAAINGEIYD